MKIQPIPDIDKDLLVAAKTGLLVPFIGAGVSRLAGCPSWDDFANGAIKFFVTHGKFNLSQFEQIKHLHPRVKLSIALALEEETRIRIKFEDILHPHENPYSELGKRLYGNLGKFSKVFVTTNYDRWLKHEYLIKDISITGKSDPTTAISPQERTLIFKPQEFTIDKLANNTNTVVHLHGSLEAPQDMILTVKDYLVHYRNDRVRKDGDEENPVLTFLGNLFKSRNVFFIGYGLEELEILEYVIEKAADNRGNRHYILQGFYSHEIELATSLKSYFQREFGVQLIPFSMDLKGWGQLTEVIQEYAKEMPIADTLTIQKTKDMRELLK